MHDSVAVTLVVLPVSFIEVATCVGHLALAPLHASLPLTLVDGAILVVQLAVAVSHSVEPCPVVLHAFLRIDVLALAVAESIEHISLVSAAIGPGVVSSASYLVFLEIAFVDRPISPFERSPPVEEPPPELSLVLMTIFELASSLPVVDVANLDTKCE